MGAPSPVRWRGHAPLVAVAVTASLWGAWWIPLRAFSREGLAGDWVTFAFSMAATLLMLPAAIVRRRRITASAAVLVVSGLLGGLSSAAYNHGVMSGDIVRVSLLFYLTPVWASVFGAVLLGERLGAFRLVSIALGFAGATVVLGHESGLPIPEARAEWMGFASGILWAAALTVFRKARDVPSYEKSFANFTGSAVAAAGFALLLPGGSIPEMSVSLDLLPAIAALSAVWLIPMVLVELWASSRLDPGRVGVVLLLEVAVSAVTATLIAGEAFGWRDAAGCLLVIAAGLVELRAHAREIAR
ncbi:MAG: DMT family transporter [Alphaproteobacteria bacterium]